MLMGTYLELAPPDATEPLHRGELDGRQDVLDFVGEEVVGVLLGPDDDLDLLPGEVLRERKVEGWWLCCLVLSVGHQIVGNESE